MAFLPNSTNVRLEDGVLRADVNGTASEIPLDVALGNINGQFKCGFKNVTGSARNLSLSADGILTGQLKNESGDWVDASTDLKEDISDSTGALKFEHVHALIAIPNDATPVVLAELSQALAAMPQAKIQVAEEKDGAATFYINAGAGVEDDTVFRTFNAEATAAIMHTLKESERDIEKVNVDVLSANASASVSGIKIGDAFIPTYAGAEAGVNLVKAQVSAFDLQIGLGVDTGFGVKDGSLTTEVAGCGFVIGKKVGISVLGSSFAVDFGKLFGGW
ncbi:hypothetical protein JCM8097_002173 [Rhodosporidiobolus ruineniae]